MQKRQLGKTGYQVSEIGLGCWQIGSGFGSMGDDTAAAIFDEASVHGVNFWDTANVYGDGTSETRIGQYLPKTKGVLVATKLGRGAGLFPDNYSKQGVKESLEGSAKRLGVETLDLAQLHCVPIDVLRDGEIFEWMEEIKKDGLVQHWGASVETIEEAHICIAHPGVATLQIIFNLFRQDAVTELLPKALLADVGIIVRLPLASGLLSGRFGKDHRFAAEDHRNFNRDGAAFNVGETFSGLPFEKGVELTAELATMVPEGVPMSQFALRWILDHPAVSTVIAGVSRPDQLRANAQAADLPALPTPLMAQLTEFYQQQVRPHVRGGI